MKKLFILAFALIISTSIKAQDSEKDWSIIPRVGLNLSNLGDMDVWYGDNEKATPRTMPDFFAGAEFDYRIHPAVSVSIGAFYSRQGCHYKNYSVSEKTSQTGVVHVEGMENQNIHLQYLNIPVMGKLHISESVALKAGIQCGVYLSGNWVSDYSEMDIRNGETQNIQSTHDDSNLNWMCAKTVWSIPVGVEFEYSHVIVSASYAIPLTGFCKSVDMLSTTGKDKISNGCNKVLSFSVGYRL